MARSRFCPKCGTSITEGRLCSDCTTEEIVYETPLVQVSEFSRSFEKGRWVKFDDLEMLIKKKVQLALGRKIPVELEPFEFIPAPKTKAKLVAHVTIEGKDLTLPVKLSYMQCDFGQKQKTGYFEGILQIQNPHEEVVKYLNTDLAKVFDKGIFVTKTVDTKKGFDLYFTNKNYLRIVGQRLVDKFGGELTLNAQLFTRNHLTSKDVFRLNALVKLPTFKKNEVITYDVNKVRVKEQTAHIVKITSMGKLIKGVDLFKGNIVAFEMKFIKDPKVIPQIETTVSSIHPTLSIIDTETFQEIQPLNKALKKKYNVNDKVKMVKAPIGAFIVE